jgi:predicted dienelactone hydrolase
MTKLASMLAACAIALAFPALAQTAPSQPPTDAPELAQLGAFAVGTVERTITLPPRAMITPAGEVALESRALKVRVWYPATSATGVKPTSYPHEIKHPGAVPIAFETPGIAIEGAVPVSAKRFPLVLVSHGFGGWGTFLSYLTENLASKGYVVAAVDHADQPFDSVPGFALSFGNVALNRAEDQRGVLRSLLDMAAKETSGFAAQINTSKIGLVGYSMGSFGALATAGATYDPASKTVSQLPTDAQAALLKSDAVLAKRIKALVVIAPWGGQPDNRSWTADALGKVTAPTLMIDGDRDDVVNFAQGPVWIFDHLKGVDRRLLVYQNARHNVGGNPAPEAVEGDFNALEYFSEPVWRGDRINAINQHFITAFLDLNLKDEATKATYLDVPTINAGDGDWPMVFGQQLGGTVSGDAQPHYWRGFQRRWALGLEMRKLTAGH